MNLGMILPRKCHGKETGNVLFRILSSFHSPLMMKDSAVPKYRTDYL